MSESNNVNYGFDNTLCSVDISSQGADEINLNRICEVIDDTKIKWIDACKKLPEITRDGKVYLVMRHCYLPHWGDNGYEVFEKVYPAEYIAEQKIWQIQVRKGVFDYCNALIDKLEIPHCIVSVPRWAYIPGDKEDEDEM